MANRRIFRSLFRLERQSSFQSGSFGAGSTGILVVLVALLVCCAPVSDNYPTLVNQGALALSTTNPYHGANLFLSKELQHSSYLFNFFKSRGAPVAIEIDQAGMNPTRLLMYYPRDREAYAADLVEDQLKRREWIVRGPFEIERQDLRSLLRMETSMIGEPVFDLYGKQFRFRFQRPGVRPDSELKKPLAPIVPEVPPTPSPTPKAKKKSAIITAPHGSSTPTPAPSATIDMFKPLSSDQQAILMSRGFARRDSNGDVLHTVQGDKQTLQQIVKWYTGADNALEDIARLNGLSAAGALAPGSVVRVPFKLVKEGKALPSS